MKTSDKILILAGSLIAVALATSMIFFTLNDALLTYVTSLLFSGIGNKMVVVAISLLVIIVAIKIMLDTTQKTNPYMAAIASQDSIGQVNINISALEKTVWLLTKESGGIDDARVFIEPKTKGVKVTVEIETPSGENIAKITSVLQRTIKEKLEKGIGVKVLEVEVLVKSLGVLDTSSMKIPYREA